MPDPRLNDVVDRGQTPSFSAGRRFGFGFNTFVAVAACLAVVVMVNYLAARHFKRFRFGNQSTPALTPQTRAVLKSLTNDIRVVVLFDADEPLYPSVSALLSEYRHASPRLKLDYVDYVRDPATARLIKERYRLEHLGDKDLVLFDGGGKVRTVYQRELSDYDYSGLMAGTTNEVKRTAFKGELLFTSALLSVSDPRPTRAYYLIGHGEHKATDDNDPNSYTKFLQMLQLKNFAVEGLTLIGTNEVPADCQVLLIAGPRDLFGKSETDKLDRYLAQGGRALVLLNPLAPTTGIERMLANWSIAIGNNLVVDPKFTVNGVDILAGNFGTHPAVRGLFGTSGVHMMTPRTVERLGHSGTAADAPKVEDLIRTSEQGIAVTDTRGGILRPAPGDRRGNLSLAVAVEKGGLQGVQGDRGATRLVVVGESSFLSNQLIDSGVNRDFASLAVNWLLDRPALLAGIGPRPVKEYRLNLTRDQMLRLRLMVLGVIPGSALLLGGLVWWRRRH